jgi:transcriptional regulator with XRE-family HTH domain
MDHSRDEIIMKNFGKNLKKIRLQKKLSLRKLADLADMAHFNIHEIELGKVNPGLITIVILAEALQVDACALMPSSK